MGTVVGKFHLALAFVLAMAASSAIAADDTKVDDKADGATKSQAQQKDKEKSTADQPFVRRGPPGVLPPNSSGLSNKPKQ